MDIELIDLERLEAHPANANVMRAVLFEKLKGHIERTDRYPPVIVRRGRRDACPTGPGERYQILDGHHRVKALRALGRAQARCVVWEVTDEEALVLLATLNRLQGRDDVSLRASLMEELTARVGSSLASVAALVPEGLPDLRHLLDAAAAPVSPRGPRPLEAMPVAVHFFLLPAQKSALERRLREAGGTREEALMRLVEGGGHGRA
ncbi:MAG: ParB/RepB/Spo0J family partition protein [Planctomycetes bacterium]|nr:ParB/RepB/Spo0J family partition protein [Planctomycetota bacterium]